MNCFYVIRCRESFDYNPTHQGDSCLRGWRLSEYATIVDLTYSKSIDPVVDIQSATWFHSKEDANFWIERHPYKKECFEVVEYEIVEKV